jgi:phosphoglycolate phosphatase
MERPRAIIFDFDGTLVDSYPATAASVNHVRALRGLTPLSESEVRKHVGRGPAYLLEHTVPGTEVEVDLASYRAHHPSVLRSGTRLLPGVEPTLRRLHDSGLKLAVCSNKPQRFTLELVEFLRLAPLLQAVVGAEDGRRLKPAPDMLLEALRQTQVPPSEALYVGDMVVDIQTGRAAGVRVWVIPTGSDDRATLVTGRPDRVMDRFGELLTLLQT